MPKNEFTPRDELVCGKLDALHEAIIGGRIVDACDLVELVRHDCERMERKLIERKTEADRRGTCRECKHWRREWDYDEWRDESFRWYECNESGNEEPCRDERLQDGTGFCHRFERKT